MEQLINNPIYYFSILSVCFIYGMYLVPKCFLSIFWSCLYFKGQEALWAYMSSKVRAIIRYSKGQILANVLFFIKKEQLKYILFKVFIFDCQYIKHIK